MISCTESGGASVESTEFNPGTIGKYDLPEALVLVPFLHKKITANFGTLKFKNSFARIYQNGNYLKCHTDRPGLHVTLSVCVYDDTGVDWPMHFSKRLVNGPWNSNWKVDAFKQSYSSFVTAVGDGVVCLGTRVPHWREPLACAPDKKIIQVFYHWGF